MDEPSDAPARKLRNELRRSKGGRPAKITMAVVEAVGKSIALGMTEEQACLGEGVNPVSFHSATMRKPEFATAIKRAQVEFLKVALPKIAAGKDWYGLAWLLERRHGSQFRRTDTSVVAVAGDGGFVLNEEEFAELERIAKEKFCDSAPGQRR
jgi:hypothetical protein